MKSFIWFVAVVGGCIGMLLTLKHVGWIGRSPAADMKVMTPEVAAPVVKAPTVTVPPPAVVPKESKKPKRRGSGSRSVPMERQPTDDNSVPAIPEQQAYSVPPPKRGSVIGPKDVSGLYTISAPIEVAPQTETSKVKIQIRVVSRAKQGFSTMVTSGDFALVPDGAPAIELGQRFTHNVPSGESIDLELEFDIPHGSTRVKLRIRNFGDKKDVVLDLAPPKPTFQPASPQGPASPQNAVV